MPDWGRNFSPSVCELRNGLEGLKEHDQHASEAIINTRTLVATEWILHGGRELLRELLLNVCQMSRVLSPMKRRSFVSWC